MKLQISAPVSTVAIVLTIACAAQAEWTNLTASDYQLEQSGYPSVIAALDSALDNVYVSDIMADLNHANPSSSPNVKNLIAGTAYGWESSADFNDAGTVKWYPQGITTTSDAYEAGEYDGYKAHIISWHSDNYGGGKRGARITFVDPATKRYRHVLLVQPTGTDNFEAIERLHAGGIFWYGTMLYVVSTGSGLLVFDLQHMYKVDTSSDDQIGKTSDGKYAAYGYKYVLPQVRTYTWQTKPDTEDLTFSCVSLDRTTTPDSLVVGEYDAIRADGRLIRWDLDYTTRLLKTTNGIATATTAVQQDESQIQGVTSINGKYFLTQSLGALITHTWADGKTKHRSVFPIVPEDLSYEKGLGLWSLTEVPGSRNVFAIDVAQF